MNITIFVTNISEDVWTYIQSLHKIERQQEVNENTFLSDRDILTFSNQTRNILILPSSIDPTFLQYYQNLFDNHQLEVFTPQKHTGEICRDIIRDKSLIKKLLSLGSEHTLVIKSYSASYQFLELVAELRSKGVTVKTPESPETESSWAVNYFGSKSGIRQITDQLSHLSQPWMPSGKIVQGMKDVASLAASQYLTHKAVVLKTNKAHAGAGVKIFRSGDLPDHYQECYQQLLTFLKQESYWQLFPVVVEKFLDIDLTIGGGNPNCEYLINDQNQLQFLFYCGMRVSEEGVFRGIEIHEDVLPATVVSQLVKYGQELGQTYIKSGYKGYFDVDCVYTRQQELFITESNVRRTGGTHVYHVAKQLIGDDFMRQRYILSNNSYPLPEGKYVFSEVYEKIKPILFSAETKEGLIIASANVLHQSNFAYIILGKNKDRAMEIEQKMERLLKKN